MPRRWLPCVLMTSAAICVSAMATGCAGPGATAPSQATGTARAMPRALFYEPFDRLDQTRWREVEVKGRTDYSIATIDHTSCLKAHSRSGASIMVYSIRFNPERHPWISWRWRVDKHVEKEALKERGGSDAAARVYVYFDTPGLPWQKRSLDYVWSANQPVGAQFDSAFSKAAKILVVESGDEHLDRWRAVSRNIAEDYARCFRGRKLSDVVAIGLMTDADNTRSEALAYFDDLQVSRERPPEAAH